MEGTARVAITHGGQELASREVSSHTPQVTLTSPNGAEVLSGDEFEVSWTGSDDNGDTLSFALDFSVDGGAHWQTVRKDITSSSMVLHPSHMPGTSQGKFRVRASDGVNTAQDESDATFSLPDKAHMLVITSPTEGATYVPGQPVALVA